MRQHSLRLDCCRYPTWRSAQVYANISPRLGKSPRGLRHVSIFFALDHNPCFYIRPPPGPFRGEELATAVSAVARANVPLIEPGYLATRLHAHAYRFPEAPRFGDLRLSGTKTLRTIVPPAKSPPPWASTLSGGSTHSPCKAMASNREGMSSARYDQEQRQSPALPFLATGSPDLISPRVPSSSTPTGSHVSDLHITRLAGYK